MLTVVNALWCSYCVDMLPVMLECCVDMLPVMLECCA